MSLQHIVRTYESYWAASNLTYYVSATVRLRQEHESQVAFVAVNISFATFIYYYY